MLSFMFQVLVWSLLLWFVMFLGFTWYQRFQKKTEENYNREDYKLLHLVLYSLDDGGPYDTMYQLLSPYYQTQFPHIKTVFYAYSETLDQPFAWLASDVLAIQGKETYVPGILEKTLKAFSYFQPELQPGREYNYVIRSNVSTLVDFDVLVPLLQRESFIEYGGGYMNDLQWLDPPAGVTDKTWYGTKFGSGTSILLSSDNVLDLLKHETSIRKEFVDDLAIGIYFREHRPDVVPKGLPKNAFVFVEDVQGDKEQLQTLVNQKKAFYRNRTSGGRKVDVHQMQVLIQLLQQQRLLSHE